jgi:hypothetical protein
VEQNPCNEQVQPHETAAFDSPVNLEIVHYRQRQTDVDGCSAKAAIDGIVAAGILPDDSAKWIQQIKTSVVQSKVEKTVFRFEEI